MRAGGKHRVVTPDHDVDVTGAVEMLQLGPFTQANCASSDATLESSVRKKVFP